MAVLGIALVLEVAWFGFLGPMPMVLAVPLIFFIALLTTVPYLIDRLVAPRVGGMPGTLVFPLATTTVWYLLSLASPWGTALNPAHTQYGDLPLLQLLAHLEPVAQTTWASLVTDNYVWTTVTLIGVGGIAAEPHGSVRQEPGSRARILRRGSGRSRHDAATPAH